MLAKLVRAARVQRQFAASLPAEVHVVLIDCRWQYNVCGLPLWRAREPDGGDRRALDDPDRLDTIRVSNVRHMLAAHDWGHRIELMTSALGDGPTLAQRKRRDELRRFSDSLSEGARALGKPVISLV